MEQSGGILHSWVQGLGLRHQGALLTAVRGCDTAPKNDASKKLVRCFRETILRAHCGDPAKAATFIETVNQDVLVKRFEDFRKDLDHYPHHYVAHLMHAIEIVGYKHPNPETRRPWHNMYLRLCKDLHVNPETENQLDARLNASETEFATQDH